MNEPTPSGVRGTPAKAPNDAPPPTERTYSKPIIRRYDQIEQVKPYGPSELEAG